MPGRFTSNGITARCAWLAAQRVQNATEAASPGRGGERHRASSDSTRVSDVVIHIFSEGEPSEFGPLGRIPGFRSQFHLSEPLDTTFHHLVSAHALVMARSTLSDMAALLSDGLLFAPSNAQEGGGQIRYIHGHKNVNSC
jgi:hypothetical protein